MGFILKEGRRVSLAIVRTLKTTARTLREEPHQFMRYVRYVLRQKIGLRLDTYAWLQARRPKPGPGMRQLIVDVSLLSRTDAGTGIQRVTRNIAKNLILRPPANYRVELAWSDGGPYRYARRFAAKLFHQSGPPAGDRLVRVRRNDVFLGLDLNPHLADSRQLLETLRIWRISGVRLTFVLYDLLPELHPEWFTSDVVDLHRRWLRTISKMANSVRCISQALATEYRQWLVDQSSDPHPKIGHFHLGADFGPLSNNHTTLECGDGFTLMVGTVEPRKGHAEVIDAYESLWANGSSETLVIVGKKGWKVDSLAQRLDMHRERGNRLFWYQGADDGFLDSLYLHASGVLMASHGEGFGLPMIESARYGRPILARDIPVFRETAGPHATYASAFNAETISRWRAEVGKGIAPLSGSIPILSWAESAAQLLTASVE
jgi:glycosyltransferase involved in cell wall biosynthesis